MQEEVKLNGMVQKLESAVQQLDSPCHFTVRLIMDDSALTAILANLKLGEIRTGDPSVGALGAPAAASASVASASAPHTPPASLGYHSGCSSPERPSSAASAHGSSSASAHISPSSSVPFSLNASSHSFSPPSSPLGFSTLRSRVVSDGRLSSAESESSSSWAVAQALQPPPQAGGRRRRNVSKSPAEVMEPLSAPVRRRLSQP